ncbi:hypothetical protein TWF173_000358 [Orbilia oligospora]|nr:hypothetical protein TWF173_000358 [Orbilia oligospora]
MPCTDVFVRGPRLRGGSEPGNDYWRSPMGVTGQCSGSWMETLRATCGKYHATHYQCRVPDDDDGKRRGVPVFVFCRIFEMEENISDVTFYRFLAPAMQGIVNAGKRCDSPYLSNQFNIKAFRSTLSRPFDASKI